MDVDESCWAKIGKYLLFVSGLVAMSLAWDESDDLANIVLRSVLAVWGFALIAISLSTSSVMNEAQGLEKASLE